MLVGGRARVWGDGRALLGGRTRAGRPAGRTSAFATRTTSTHTRPRPTAHQPTAPALRRRTSKYFCSSRGSKRMGSVKSGSASSRGSTYTPPSSPRCCTTPRMLRRSPGGAGWWAGGRGRLGDGDRKAGWGGPGGRALRARWLGGTAGGRRPLGRPAPAFALAGSPPAGRRTLHHQHSVVLLKARRRAAAAAAACLRLLHQARQRVGAVGLVRLAWAGGTGLGTLRGGTGVASAA